MEVVAFLYHSTPTFPIPPPPRRVAAPGIAGRMHV